MTCDLTNQVAVVTGGGGVLCSRFSVALAQCGARVAVLNRTLAKAQTVVDEIRRCGGEAIAIEADVTDKNSLLRARDEVVRTYGECDILINGAGGNNPIASCDDEFFNPETLLSPDRKSFFNLEEFGFSAVFNLNMVGVLLPSQVFGQSMAERSCGTIINISSMNAFTPLTKIPAYSSAKAAVSNFTQWLAVYFAKCGVRVNAIAPGFFSTQQNKVLLWNSDGTPTARTNKILSNTPMGRLGTPEELIGTLLWLCDREASGFVTGVVVPVDGGFSAYSGV